MMHLISCCCENLTFIVCAYALLGKWDRTRMRIAALIVFALHLGATHLTVLGIPVFAHVLIIAVWLKCLYWKRHWWEALWTALVVYGGVLLYLQAIYMLWVPDGWYDILMEPEALPMNATVFVVSTLLCMALRKLYPDGLPRSVLFYWISSAASLVMMIICQFYRVQVTQTHKMVSQIVSAVVILTLGGFLIFHIISERKKVKTYQEKLDERYKEQHDYLKKLKYLEKQYDKEMYEEVRKEEEEKFLLENLDGNLSKVLKHYKEEAEENGVRLYIRSSALLSWELSHENTLVIVGNLLENAIHAAEKLPEDERWVEVELHGDGDGGMSIINPCSSEGAQEKREGHGYGLELTKELADRSGIGIGTERMEGKHYVHLFPKDVYQ